MDEFLNRLKETLDVDELGPDTVLEDLEEWDSLAALSVIALLSSQYRVNLPAADLKGGKTVQALFDGVMARKGN
ncbi:acyl carrier protein [Mesoterricola sediminis]|uniref:Carrier domain-containing protein n=1 Tax=Mesoterricola sediminis TaxID=2927980 RepID=A0AA48GVQ2_9BACT|nr:acyl carrier protein [Mesoterricola sediminis]BDU78684.1 hypothetical protein METESE_36420 [Mesoterricola sediminis]